jgi:hypothetical protein
VARLLGRDSVVERIAAAVDRARVAGGGTVVVYGRAVWTRALWVEEALRPFGTKFASAARALQTILTRASRTAFEPPEVSGACRARRSCSGWPVRPLPQVALLASKRRVPQGVVRPYRRGAPASGW